MARAPDSRIEQAEAMFHQGMKLVEIASQLNLPEGTVRRWKSTHKWESERSLKDNERSINKANVRKEKKKAVAEEVKQVMENPDLTDKQRLFCLQYIRCFNATKAYQKAYGVDYSTAASIGYRLLENVGVREEIARLKQNRLNRELLDEHDIFQKYMDIAFADITDFAKVNGGYVEAQTDFDGTLVSEISATENGVKIKLADRMKALDWLAARMDLATAEQRARIVQMQVQTERMALQPAGDEDGVEIINDTEKEAGQDQ